MTPQQKAMASVLYISLVKWAETMHAILDKHRDDCPELDHEFRKQSEKIEAVVDQMMKEHGSASHEETQCLIDELHHQIVNVKQTII